MYKSLSSHITPNVIQLTTLKPKIPIESQLSAPTIVKISAITEKTLKVFFKLLFLLVSCTRSMQIRQKNIRKNQGSARNVGMQVNKSRFHIKFFHPDIRHRVKRISLRLRIKETLLPSHYCRRERANRFNYMFGEKLSTPKPLQ